MRLRTSLMLTCAMVAITSPAFAQNTGTAGGSSEATSLVEIVVTANKRSESISTVPISIAAETQQELDAKGIKNIGDLARTTPGVTFRSNDVFDNPSIAVRGILSNVGAATTGVYIDETPVQARSPCFFCGSSAFPQLFDLDRVEVLRGPQGTLFGAGSQGGTLRFITPAPSLTRYSSYARSELASTKDGGLTYEGGAAVGGPIVEDKLGFRASLWGRKDGGYIDRVDRITGDVLNKNVNNLKSYVGRVALTWRPMESLEITPSFFYQKNETGGRNLYHTQVGKFRNMSLIEEIGKDRQAVSSVKAVYSADWGSVTSVTSYYDRAQTRVDDYSSIEATVYSGGALTYIPGYVAANDLHTKQKNWTQEIRASSNGGERFNWTAGVYYAHNKSLFTQGTRQDLDLLIQPLFGMSALDFFGVPPVGPNGEYSYLDDQSQVDKELAAFGEVSWNFTEQLKLSAGARISRSKFNTSLTRSGPEAGGDVAVDDGNSDTPFTPRATLSYQKDGTLVYGTVAKGYRIGGGNTSLRTVGICAADLATLDLDDVPSTYGSDTVWSYEAGSKTRFAGGRGRIGASIYRIDWKNIQTNVVLPTCLYNYTDNVGGARSTGFDVDASYSPIRGLNIDVAAGYNDAHYTTTNVAGSSTIAIKGQALPISKWTVSLGVGYDFTVGDQNLYVRTDYQFNSAISSSSPEVSGYDPETNRTDPLHVTSLRAGWRKDGLDVSLFANNLFDEEPTVLLARDGTVSTEFRRATIRPRTIGLSLTYRN